MSLVGISRDIFSHPSVVPLSSKEPSAPVLSTEEKLSLGQEISSHHWKGTPLVVFGAITLFVSLVLLLIGALLLGYPIEGFSFVQDILLPFLLPAILGIVGVTIPLFFFASFHHVMAMEKHKQLAESNYRQILEYCLTQQKEVTKKKIIDFIETHVLLPQYTRRFSFVTLSQTLDVLSRQPSSQSSVYDSLISESIRDSISGIFMMKYEKDKRKQKEEKEEQSSIQHNSNNSRSPGVSIHPTISSPVVSSLWVE